MYEALNSWHIGRAIRAYRLHEHWPEPIAQAIVGNWLGITQAQLSRIENGAAVTDLAKLIPIAHALGIPADLLWFRLPSDVPGKPRLSTCDRDHAVRSIQLTATDGDGAVHTLDASQETSEDDAMTPRRELLQGILA
ncbi:MAG: helix-turn-helix domain-containing protein, partial [Dehalococcoidia bacterium]